MRRTLIRRTSERFQLNCKMVQFLCNDLPSSCPAVARALHEAALKLVSVPDTWNTNLKFEWKEEEKKESRFPPALFSFSLAVRLFPCLFAGSHQGKISKDKPGRVDIQLRDAVFGRSIVLEDLQARRDLTRKRHDINICKLA